MRIVTFALTGLLFSGSLALAETPLQQVHQDNKDIRQLNKDIHNNQVDRTKDAQVMGDERSDLQRDRLDRNADQRRENQDIAKGNYKGASYWNNQRIGQNAAIASEKKDLTHTRKDLNADKARIAKDVKVRNHDVAKRNKAASKL
jgi:hypothetical protein